MIISLSQNMLSQLTCPEGKSHIEYCDKGLPGLLLDIYPSGAATWKLRYKMDSATKYFSFGPLSEVTLSQATKMALDMKAQIRAQGRDPRAEIKAKKEQLTFDEFYEQYLKPYCMPRKRSWARDEQLYRIRIKDKFGNKRLNQITRHQIQSFHTELLEEGLSHASCDLHLKFLKHAFNLAIDWNLLAERNSAARIPLYNKETIATNYRSDSSIIESGNQLMNGLGVPARAREHAGLGEVRIVEVSNVWLEFRVSAQFEECRVRDSIFLPELMDGKAPSIPQQKVAKALKTAAVLYKQSAFKSLLLLSRTKRPYGVDLNEYSGP